MNKVVPILAVIAGLYWVFQGFHYGLWVRSGPGGGFIPIIAGLIVVFFAFSVLWADRRGKTASKFQWAALVPLAALLGMVIISYLIGLILSLALYMFIWLCFIEKHKLAESLMISTATTAIIYGVFIMWLKVPMPKGIWGLL